MLAGLLERITEEGRRLAAIADLKVSDMSAQAPVGTTLAILVQTTKWLKGKRFGSCAKAEAACRNHVANWPQHE